MGDTLADLGEFGLIQRLVRRLPAAEGVLLGPGDDAAVLARPAGPLLAAADLLVEGRHFDLAFSSPEDVGAKALAVNASDIAAMGGRPRYALVSVGAPAATPVATLEALYDGLAAVAAETGIAIVGGDTVGAGGLVVSVAVLGEPGDGGIVRRDGARPGDALVVTGELGAAAAGLALLRAGRDADAGTLAEAYPGLITAHRRGRARVSEGMAAAAGAARAMIDISDGLGADVGHICEASRVGVTIDGDTLPVATGVAEVEAWLAGDRPPAAISVLAARGGDDYELAIAIAEEDVGGLAAALDPTPVTRIGTFTDGAQVEVTGLAEAEFAALGWDSFRGTM